MKGLLACEITSICPQEPGCQLGFPEAGSGRGLDTSSFQAPSIFKHAGMPGVGYKIRVCFKCFHLAN